MWDPKNVGGYLTRFVETLRRNESFASKADMPKQCFTSQQIIFFDTLSFVSDHQRKMQEQARLSNLAFPDTNKDEMPQWKSDSWPPLLGGWRRYHASVVVNEEKKGQQTVVVIGGQKAELLVTNSVLLMDLERWRKGPSLNQHRGGLAAVVCNGSVYAMGGRCDGQLLDSIERIDLLDLLKSPCATNNKTHWKTLTCTLSTPRDGSQAAVVHNRFIVVVGGDNYSFLSSTDIIDTTGQNQHIVIPGPSMTVPRYLCGMAVVDHRIFVIGGMKQGSKLNSVEYLDFSEVSHDNNEDVHFSFPSSFQWNVHKDLVLSVPRYAHAVAKVGTCLIVTGGDSEKTLKSVEVLDTKRNVVFNLPDMIVERKAHSAVSFLDRIVVIGGTKKTCESLASIDMKENTKVRSCYHKPLKEPLSYILTTVSCCFFAQSLQNRYSCRAELDMELEKMKSKIQLANRHRSNVKALQEAIEAESLLPLMEWLRNHDDKFRSVHELRAGIDELKGKLRDIDSFMGCLPIARKIEKLRQLVDWNESFGDQKNLTEQEAELEVEAGSVTGKETLLVSERTTREFVDLNVSFGDEKNLAGQKAEDEFEFVSVTGNETLQVSRHSTDDLSNVSYNPEERLMKLEDMMVQLSDRFGVLENLVLSKKN